MFLFFCVLFFLSSASHASFISLNTSLEVKTIGNKVLVDIYAVNKGDEPAYSVQAEVKTCGQPIMAAKKDMLGVNEPYHAIVTYALKACQPGQYPLMLIMHYADANQYPFSAPVLRKFEFKAQDRPADVFGKMNSITFWKDSQIKVLLKNQADKLISAEVILVLPQELFSASSKYPVKLGPRSEAEIIIPINNFSALSGSNYQVFAVAQYVIDGYHQSVIVPGMIKIEELNFFKQYKNAIFAAIAGLFLLFIVSQFIKNEKT